jgi:hypothetical protein
MLQNNCNAIKSDNYCNNFIHVFVFNLTHVKKHCCSELYANA